MELRLRPETESRLQEIAEQTGRPAGDLVEDAMAGYLQELAQTRETLDGRYDELTSGQVKPMNGEDAFATLRHKSEERRRP
jgi:predicted DNA-binding protein